MTWGIFKHSSVADAVAKVQKEGWDDMLKSVKDKNGPQPNGGSGKKQGTRYGGGKQKEDESEKRKEKNESVEVSEANEYKVYSNSHNDPEHHTKHSTLDSAKAELAKHQGGALYHKNKLYNKKTGMFESVDNQKQQYKVYSNAHNDPEHHTTHDTLDSAKKEYEKHAKNGGAMYHGNKLYNRKTDKFESVELNGSAMDEEVQQDIIKLGAKEIKHANVKDKQNDQEIMEPHSKGEADFLDKHSVQVTDDPAGNGSKTGADKLKHASEPTAKGPGSYDAKEKLGKQGVKEDTSEEGGIKEGCSGGKASGKKTFFQFQSEKKGK